MEAGSPRNYPDPIAEIVQPRPGNYLTTYYPSERLWFLVPVAYPCS